ncbi:MAG TPA: alpha-hydroxy-acid oxidizing protein [Treponemataceae bacterium]|nr:alpha-hydroxy-acid oxidizing protein [Treponemataceae bacterium]
MRIVIRMEKTSGYKCRFCAACNGYGCRGELPGMGGVDDSANCILNYTDWGRFADGISAGEIGADEIGTGSILATLRLAPMTGAVQNLGYCDEKSWYFDIVEACIAAGVPISIGDGYPDEKLQYGIEALRANGAKGAVFIKPYPDGRILERFSWAEDVAEIIGIDIDAYAIATMRDLVSLERKTAQQLVALKAAAPVPFALKGVFSRRDVELVREVKPDIAVVSNHGGRVPAERGSSAAFLAGYGAELARYAGEVWVDGGIRHARDLCTAGRLGARTVLVGRPFATALMKGGAPEVIAVAARLCGGISLT